MVKILDCTIRDGGHLTGWNFSDECVRETFEAAQKCGIDFFEIGYRNHGTAKFAHSQDEDIRGIIKDKGEVKLAVMVNAREFAADNFSTDDYADIVRVACHPDEIFTGVEYCKILQDKGYEAFLHLMDVAHITHEQMQALNAYDRNNVIYFADSYGALLPEDIRKYFKTFAQAGFEKIGFHAHNNKQLAFINTLTAIECGAYSVDVSAYGMGRAAGNTPAELLLSELGRNAEHYFELIKKYYLDLYEKTPWGYSLKNLEGGIKNIKVS